MSSRRSLRFPGGRKRDLRKFKKLVRKVFGALTTLLEHSKNCEKPWGAGFITDGELIEVWEKPHRKGSYLDRITALLGLYETEKAHFRNHFLKSISTLILIGLFRFDSDWKRILQENNTSADRSLPLAEHDHCKFLFLSLRQLRAFVRWQYVFLPCSIKEMESATQGNDMEQAISHQYRLPFYGVGEPLRYPGNMMLTREKIPKGLLVFKDGSRSQQTEFKDVKTFADDNLPQFARECRTQRLLKGSVNLHPNIFLWFSCISITNGPAFIVMNPVSCNLRELLRGEEQPPAQRLGNQPSSIPHDALGVASALKWLHSSILLNNETTLECIHMNLNPESILVFFNEEPGKRWKISDFSVSISRLTGEPDSESSEPWIPTARQLHTDYQAPEVTFTPNQVGYWSDVWSFGCILMEVLAFETGGPPMVKELQDIRNENTFWFESEGKDHSLRIAIKKWLIRSMENPLPWQRDWQTLTLEILQGGKDDRPSASEVYGRLGGIIGAMRGNQHDKELEFASRGIPEKDRSVSHGIQCELVPRAVQHNEQPMVSGGLQGNIEIDSSNITGSDTPNSTTDRSSIDFIKINRWLDSCEEQARCSTTASIELYKSLELHSRVIDVIRLRVVPAPNRCRYVALSYVWGGTQQSTLRRSNEWHFQLDGKLKPGACSKTIWDAILLCQRIGERYLWVDALCIVQDTEDKHAQIEAMEAVYRGAVFTIVAAAGEHADAGLPGVSDARGTPDTGNQQHDANPYSFDTAVNSSIWNARAWTYQERILSQRLLFFTSEQIFFQCSHGRTSELDLGDPHSALSRHQNTQPIELDSYKLELEDNINFDTYAQVTQEYSKRVLTHEKDIENAFGGIKKVISLLFNNSEVVSCVPIAALDISLLWYPATVPLQRRCVARAGDTLRGPFPSWSWAGWVGPVYYRDLVNISERTVSCLRWRQPEGTRVLCAGGFGKNTASWPEHEDWLRQVTPDGRPYYTKRKGNPSHWFCHPIGRSIHDPIPIDRKTGQLFFLADKAQCVSWRTDLEIYSNTLRIFHRAAGYQVGKVIMQVDHDSTEKYELLKISSTTLTHGENDPAWNGEKAQFSRSPGEPAWNWQNPDTSSALEWFDPEHYDPTVCFCLYNVLVTVKRYGISYRVGIGKIHMDAFDEFAVRDQEVRLG